jgi:hypothetical protein
MGKEAINIASVDLDNYWHALTQRSLRNGSLITILDRRQVNEAQCSVRSNPNFCCMPIRIKSCRAGCNRIIQLGAARYHPPNGPNWPVVLTMSPSILIFR